MAISCHMGMTDTTYGPFVPRQWALLKAKENVRNMTYVNRPLHIVMGGLFQRQSSSKLTNSDWQCL